MDQELFIKLVNKDVRGTHLPEDEWAILNAPENLDAWRQELVTMKQTVEAEMATKRDNVDKLHSRLRRDTTTGPERASLYGEWSIADEQFKAWHGNAIQFKLAVETRLRELKVEIRNRNEKNFTAKESEISLKLAQINERLDRIIEKLEAA